MSVDAAEETGNVVHLIQDDAAIIKAAFVGEPQWKDAVYAFVAKPLRAIPMDYFTDESAARAWLDT